MDNINYKFLTKIDIENYQLDIIRLMNNILRENIYQKYPENLSSEYVNRLPEYIENETALVVGAFNGNHLVGFLWCYFTEIFTEKRLHLDFVGVNIKYQHQGIAHKMLRLVEEKAKERGVFLIEAMVTANNINSCNFHKKQGFKIERFKMKKVIK